MPYITDFTLVINTTGEGSIVVKQKHRSEIGKGYYKAISIPWLFSKGMKLHDQRPVSM